jgi:hypothetical protein
MKGVTTRATGVYLDDFGAAVEVFNNFSHTEG